MKLKILTLRMLSIFLIKGSEDNKVRLAFEVPNHKEWMLLYTTDRVSVGDRVVGEFNGKGSILNIISAFIKALVSVIVPTDLVAVKEKEISALYGCDAMSPALKGRLCIIKKATVIPFECIVRMRLKGSLFKAYAAKSCKAGCYFGYRLPAGMKEGDVLPMPIFTPSTKAPAGQHDENIDYDRMVYRLRNWIKEKNIVGWTGDGLAQTIRSTSLAVAMAVSALAEKQGLIYEDTKFEFGLIPTWEDGRIVGYMLVLIDEVMTPDSSRIVYKGRNVCKQYLRNVVDQLKQDGKEIVFTKEVEKTFINNYRVVKTQIKHLSFYEESFAFYKSRFCAKICT